MTAATLDRAITAPDRIKLPVSFDAAALSFSVDFSQVRIKSEGVIIRPYIAQRSYQAMIIARKRKNFVRSSSVRHDSCLLVIVRHTCVVPGLS